MIKDQEYLKSKALYCLDLAKKLGATDASVTVGNLSLTHLTLPTNREV